MSVMHSVSDRATRIASHLEKAYALTEATDDERLSHLRVALEPALTEVHALRQQSRAAEPQSEKIAAEQWNYFVSRAMRR